MSNGGDGVVIARAKDCVQVMCKGESADPDISVSLASACFEQIAAVLQESIEKATRIGAADMVDRLKIAKAAAERGRQLTEQLAAALDVEQLHRNSLPPG